MKALALSAAAVLAACSGSTPPCDPPSNFGCDPALQCEQVSGGSPECLPPVVISGKVVDVSSLRPVSNARVALLDGNGVPVSAAGTSRLDGVWVVRVPTPRSADGTPTARMVTERVDASGYGTFPDGFRGPVTLSTGGASLVTDGSEWLVTAPDLRLVSGAGGFGTGQLFGTVQLPPTKVPILVTAEPLTGPGTGASTLADATGAYRLFGLPPGNYIVRALAKGYEWQPGAMTVSSMSQLEVDLRFMGATTSRVTGTVTYATGASGPTTVMLAPAITYDAGTARADFLPGLSTQIAGPGPFSIDGVSAGNWVVLVSYPIDGLVATQAAPTVTVTTNQDTAAGALNVAAAVTIVSPGATTLDTISAPPMLVWHDVMGETGYHVTVTDGIGTVVWQKDEPSHSGTDASILYQGPLVTGQIYRFHVSALNGAATLTQSETLAGAFTMPAM